MTIWRKYFPIVILLLMLFSALYQGVSHVKSSMAIWDYWINDRVFNGSETVTLENALIFNKGTITLDGNATLRVVKSTIYLSEMIELRGNSVFECVNSTLIGLKNETARIWARENSSLLFSGVLLQESPGTHYPGETIPWLSLTDNARLEGDRVILDGISSGINASCVLTRSEVGSLGVGSSIPAQLIDSTVEKLGVTYGRVDMNITENHHGYHEYWYSKEALGDTIRLNCILINSTILNPLNYRFYQCTVNFVNTSASSIMTDGDMNLTIMNAVIDYLQCSERDDLVLRVKNSTVGELSAWMSNMDVIMEDSIVDESLMISGGAAHIRINNCVIGWYQNGLFNVENVSISNSLIENFTSYKTTLNPYRFENTTITNLVNWISRYGFKMSIEGGIRFKEGARVFTRYNTTFMEVIRTYPVYVTKRGKPAAQVHVFLKRDNETIDRLSTAKNGTTKFQLSFLYDPEYKDTSLYTLQVENLEPVLVTLFTDTPIEIEIPPSASMFKKIREIRKIRYSINVMVALSLVVTILYLKMKRG